VYKKGDY
jgi:hypothetical protein